jgi:dihydropteroate synthase
MVAAIMNGAHMVRVHDVRRMKKAIAVADAIVYGEPLTTDHCEERRDEETHERPAGSA